MLNHVNATTTEEDRKYRYVTGDMKYICLSLINLNPDQKNDIRGLCNWIKEEKLQRRDLTKDEEHEVNSSRTMSGKIKRALRLRKFNHTEGRLKVNDWNMMDLFASINVFENENENDNDNDNEKLTLIFELSRITANILNKRKSLDSKKLNKLSKCKSVKRGIGIDNGDKKDYNRGKGSDDFSPADRLTRSYYLTCPAFLCYIDSMFKMKNRVGGGLKMNQRRNKTNKPNQKRKRNKTNKTNKTNETNI